MFQFFTTTTSIDFSASTDYFKESIEVVQTLLNVETGSHNVVLKINEVEMYDSIFNPFNVVTDEKEFLTVEEWSFMKVPDKLGTFEFLFSIDSSKNHS